LLVEADWNYKTEDEALSDKLVANIRRNGQLENIIVRELSTGNYEVVNGNHRLKAFQRLGYSDVLVYNCGNLTLAEAQRLAIETNETRFASDQYKLAERMAELSERFGAEDLALSTPYNIESVNGFNQIVDFDWDGFEQGLISPKKTQPEDGGIVRLRIPCTPETKALWLQWLQTSRELGSDSDATSFEWAIIAAMNVPMASLS
jgi:hypothetical protein